MEGKCAAGPGNVKEVYWLLRGDELNEAPLLAANQQSRRTLGGEVRWGRVQVEPAFSDSTSSAVKERKEKRMKESTQANV